MPGGAEGQDAENVSCGADAQVGERMKELSGPSSAVTKILVVDDEVSILRSTQLLLEDLGFEVVTTSDHQEVLDLARRERPDLVLQDVRMPGLDLDKLVATLRAESSLRHLPILLFSASMDLGETAQRVGAEGVLDKPFKPREVLEAVRSALAAAAPAGGAA
jgi:CheY-like chemotaxis protein